MHLLAAHFTVNISGSILGGVAAGAAIAALVIAVLAFIGAFAESMMSLGGSGGFGEKFFKGCRVYVPVGGIVGGGVAATGLPWWTAVPVILVLFFALNPVTKVRTRRRGY